MCAPAKRVYGQQFQIETRGSAVMMHAVFGFTSYQILLPAISTLFQVAPPRKYDDPEPVTC